MDDKQLNHLDARIKDLSQGLKHLADDKDLTELLRIIRKPGWTTPAEIAFAGGIVDSMLEHTKALEGLKRVLVVGSRAVAT